MTNHNYHGTAEHSYQEWRANKNRPVPIFGYLFYSTYRVAQKSKLSLNTDQFSEFFGEKN